MEDFSVELRIMSIPTFPHNGFSAQRGPWPLEVSTSHTKTHCSRKDSYRRVINSSQRPHLTTHNTYKKQVSIPPAGLKLAVSAGERPQTASDGAATGIDLVNVYLRKVLQVVVNIHLAWRCNHTWQWTFWFQKRQRPYWVAGRLLGS